MYRFKVCPWTFCRAMKSNGTQLKLAASKTALFLYSGIEISLLTGNRIGVLFPNPDFGSSELITVRLLVGAVISLNPTTHSSPEGHSNDSSSTQN